MKIATARSSHSKRWVTKDISWDALLERLRVPIRTDENAAAYAQMSSEQRSAIKNVGGFVGGELRGGLRRRDTVVARWCVTLDADFVEGDADEQWEDFTLLNDFACCVYSTHSHTPEKPKLRWVIPLREPVDPDMYECVARTVGERIGIDSLDDTTYEPSRLMYWPSCPCDGEYIFHEQDGHRLDAAALLREAYGSGDAWKTAEWPRSSRERETRHREYRKAGVPADKPGIIGLFCRAYSVEDVIDEFLSDLYTPADTAVYGGGGEGRRYTYVPGTVGGGAVVYDNGAFLFNHNATNPAYGNQNAFDLLRIHRFGELDADTKPGTPINKLPSYEAMLRFAAELDRVREIGEEDTASAFSDLGADDFEDYDDPTEAKTRAKEPDCDEPSSTSDGDEAAATPSKSWRRGLTLNHKTGKPEPSAANINYILSNDPRLKGRFGWNEFRSATVIRAPLPWRPRVTDKVNGDLWSDTDDAGLRLYMEVTFGIESRNKITDAWRLVAGANAFHPVREYLNGLTWDGIERLDTMLIRHLAAEDTEYVRAVSRKWMCGAVARIMRPGAKFDNMLVIIGPQGKGKSTFAAKLARGWFMDNLEDMGSKESIVQLQGQWIIEIAELSAMSKRSVEEVKAFISAPKDTARLPYDRATQELPRQCVFYGTTNSPEFLKDDTGNRRFWPVGIEGVGCGELRGLEGEVDQLWAEAVVRWKAGEVLWLSEASLREEATAQQQLYSQQDELPALIDDFLDTEIPERWDNMSMDERRFYFQSDLPRSEEPKRRRDTITIPELKVELFGKDPVELGQGTRTESNAIVAALARVPGWRPIRYSQRPGGGYPKAKTYVRIGSKPDADNQFLTDGIKRSQRNSMLHKR